MMTEESTAAEPEVRSGQWRLVGWAAAWFFFILMSYSVVRPVRETMGAIGGTEQLQGLMLVTFLVMLVAVPAYSALVNRFSRRWLVRCVFHFFCVCLIAFSASMAFGSAAVKIWSARTFFIWVNVFGLFSTSVFWSVLADLFSSEQGKRLFGRIAAGGTAGAITGSLLTSQVAVSVTTAQLLLIPAITIQLGLWCAWRLERNAEVFRWQTSNSPRNAPALETEQDGVREIPKTGGLTDGIVRVFNSPYLASICLFLFFVQAAGTQLYFQQAEIVKNTVVDNEAKTQFFAYVDFATQSLTLFGQIVLSSWILRRLGVSVALVILPTIYLVSFAGLAMESSLYVVAVAMVTTRACAYGITVPSREVLFTVVDREEKYKSKSFIDTVVLRGGDAISGQAIGSLRNIAGLSFASINLLTLPLMAFWGVAAFRLGLRQRRLADERAEANTQSSDTQGQ